VAVAENVKGMLLGNAKAYTKTILTAIEEAGYDVQLFMLDSATMGVPQTRRRVFFMCRRKDLNLPPIKLNFAGETILYKEIATQVSDDLGKPLSEAYARWWRATPAGKSLSFAHPKGSFFNTTKVHPNRVIPTITATSGAKITHHTHPNEVSTEILTLAGTFPTDYDFDGIEPKYLIGMSVPPLMIRAIALEMLKQWFPKVATTLPTTP
jgi:DNA (cytosine-5)-methyltransferase 1